MFFTLVKNYIKAFFGSIGWSKKIYRVKHTFYFDDHQIELDAYCAFPKSAKNPTNRKFYPNIIKYYEYKIEQEYDKWKVSIDAMIRHIDELDNKTIRDFMEVVILTDINAYDISTYINKISIKTRADIRDEKINKLLTSK